MTLQAALRLYVQATPNPLGFEAVCLLLDGVILARLQHCLSLLVESDLRSVSYRADGIRWLKRREGIVAADTNISVWRSGDDFGLQIETAINRSEQPDEFDWINLRADWIPPVAPLDFSHEWLADVADSNGVVLGSLQGCEFADEQTIQAQFLPSVSFDRLRDKVEQREKALGWIGLWEEVLPVRGFPADLLRFQSMLDDLDRMDSHCLDLTDLGDMFKGENGEWQRLAVSVVADGASISDELSHLASERATMIEWWFLFQSMDASRAIQMAIKALLSPDQSVLMIPVAGGKRQVGCRGDIVVITREQSV